MEEFKEAKIRYYENEINHLEQQRYVYERKLEFYSDKLNEIRNEIIKYHGIIQSVEREDCDSELKILTEQFMVNKDNILKNMRLLSDNSEERYETYMKLLKRE